MVRRPTGVTHEHDHRPRRDPRPARPAHCGQRLRHRRRRTRSRAFMRMAARVRPDLPARGPRRHPARSSPAPTSSTSSATTPGSTSWSGAAWRTSAMARPATGSSPPRPQDPLWQRAHNILMSPFSLQAMRDYMPQDARHRRAADGQVGAAQPRRGRRRPGRHDPADPGHHRALRVRLPLQLVLPRHAAPVRRGDGAHARRGAGADAPAADPDPAEDPRAAAGARRTRPS